MKERRYREAYRIVTRRDQKTGREHREAEYAGERYHFPEGTPGPRSRALKRAGPLALFWLAALAYLKTAGITGRCMYALPPFLPALFPGVYGLMGLAAMLRAPDTMTVVQRENGVGRLMRCGLGCGVFAAAGTAGGVVCLCLARAWAGAWHEPLLTAVCAAAGWALFLAARKDYHALEKAI